MGVSLSDSTTAPVTPAVRKAVLADAAGLD
jgi:hypothetical protein